MITKGKVGLYISRFSMMSLGDAGAEEGGKWMRVKIRKKMRKV